MCKKRRLKNFNPRSCIRSDDNGIPSIVIPGNFNPRSCIRSDSYTFEVSQSAFKFQSTLLYKERLVLHLLPLLMTTFQSTLLYKERHGLTAENSIFSQFQSTLLYKERQCMGYKRGLHHLFQSTLLYKERLLFRDRLKL